MNSMTAIALIAHLLVALASMVSGSQEFQVYRMQQYDFPSGSPMGSRVNLINTEARTFLAGLDGASIYSTTGPSASSSTPLSRRCVLIKLNAFSLERYRSLVNQYAGAIIIILPKTYSAKQISLIKTFEAQMLREEVKLPVYFLIESPEVLDYYSYIEKTTLAYTNRDDQSAFRTLIDSVVTNGFQFVVGSHQSKAISMSAAETQPINLQAKLNGRPMFNSESRQSASNDTVSFSNSQKIPTVIVTGHYDSFGMSTMLSYGCDSTGSGVVALLEISRLLSKLFAHDKTIPPVNILFLLSSAGKLNYHGLKKWIEEQSETHHHHSHKVGKIDLDDVQMAICLDSLARQSASLDPIAEPPLYMHVSRPPREGQATFEMQRALEWSANKSNVPFEMVHKKINLANELLAWEHERFSLNKIPAFTLSHFASHKDTDRTTMTDTIETADKGLLKRNIRVIVTAIFKFLYKGPSNGEAGEHLLSGDLNISDEFVDAWLEQICRVPRTQSLLGKSHPLVTNLYSHFTNYLSEAVKLPVKVQSKEPEFVFYNEEEATLIVSNIKPAVFDFFLSMFIACYIGLTYLFIVNFDSLFAVMSPSTSDDLDAKKSL